MSQDDDTEFEWLMILFEAQCKAVLGNKDIWDEERNCPASNRLRWPLPAPEPKAGGDRLRYIMANMAFKAVMASIKEAEGSDAVPVDVSSERFQLILRMVRRTVESTLEDARQKIGTGRISGMRAFKNRVKTSLVEQAVKSGRGVEGSGVARSAAYRALNKARRR